jgi:lysophospholipase L1-like esterase
MKKKASLALRCATIASLCFVRQFSVLFVTGSLAATSLAAVSEQWVTTWGSSQQRAEGVDNLPKHSLDGATLRQAVHISVGGIKLRVRVSNAFGEAPLVLRSVYIGPSLSNKQGSIDPRLQLPVLFNGSASATIPAGAEYVSDVISMTVQPLSDVAITMLIDKAPISITTHSGARATSFAQTGDHTLDAQLTSAESFAHWYFLEGVDVQTSSNTAVVILGDSITDGHGATTDANDRWTDVLAVRLSKAHIAVVNRGIGGNRVIEDGLGPNAVARFERDVLSTPGARYLIVLEGINDIGVLDRLAVHPVETHTALVNALETAFVQMVAQAHSQGIAVFGGTIMPFRGSGYYHPSDQSEADRSALNQWIRTSGIFDTVIDFDKAMRDPSQPDRLDPAVDSGDHLHPNPAGYKRMGELVPLDLFHQTN